MTRRTAYLAMVMAAGCTACSSPSPAPRPEVGEANVSAAIPAPALAAIDRVTVAVSGGALTAPLVQALQRVDETHFDGTVSGLPAGDGYLFAAEALGSGTPGSVLYRGELANVAISGGRAAQVLVELHEVDPGGVPTAPVLDGISTSTTAVTFGEWVHVAVGAHSLDGHALTYAWQSSCGGSFSDPLQPATDWGAPAVGGTCQLSVQVGDPFESTSVTAGLSIEVRSACVAGEGCTPADPCWVAGVTACDASDAPAICSPTVPAPDGTGCTGSDRAGTCSQGTCVLSLPFAEGMVTIALDDGMESQQLAVPALERHGFRATFFVVTSFVGGPGYLTLSQLRALASGGHEIASHTVHHTSLPTLSDAALRAELADSQSWLVANVSADAGQTFACPFGQYDERVVAVSRELYRAHRTGETRFNFADADPALLGEIVATDPVAALEAYVERAVAERSWLILGFHKLTTDAVPGEYAYNVDDFASLLAYLSSRGVRVVTVAEGAGYLSPPPPNGP